jgi:hypothetical protein
VPDYQHFINYKLSAYFDSIPNAYFRGDKKINFRSCKTDLYSSDFYSSINMVRKIHPLKGFVQGLLLFAQAMSWF